MAYNLAHWAQSLDCLEYDIIYREHRKNVSYKLEQTK